jgi:hypothetical protein
MLEMKKYWKIAPKGSRQIVIAGSATAVVIIPLQLFALYLTITGVADQMTTMDPFAVLEGGVEKVSRPTWEMFLTGFVTSFAASMGTLAVIAATRLVVPYRNRALKTVWLGGFSHIALSVATLIGVAVGNRSVDASSLGTVISALWVLPVLVLSFHPLVRAWSVPFTPTPPVLPDANK